jgi:hypothetical protein
MSAMNMRTLMSAAWNIPEEEDDAGITDYGRNPPRAARDHLLCFTVKFVFYM